MEEQQSCWNKRWSNLALQGFKLLELPNYSTKLLSEVSIKLRRLRKSKGSPLGGCWIARTVKGASSAKTQVLEPSLGQLNRTGVLEQTKGKKQYEKLQVGALGSTSTSADERWRRLAGTKLAANTKHQQWWMAMQGL